VVTISRATGSLTFPANFMLVGAMSPCPCGYCGDPVKEYTCSAMMISRYRPTLVSALLRETSGPLRGFPSVTSASLRLAQGRLRPAA